MRWGHTAGLAADAEGSFHPVWVGNRTGVLLMWSASVSVEGYAHRHGVPPLSALRDLTSKTALAVEGTEYNDSTHVAPLTVRLRNVSRDPLQAPMALKVIDLESEFGDVRLVGPEGPIKGHGAVLPITEHLTGRRLHPDSSTAPFAIEGKIRAPKELGPMQPPPPGRRIPDYGLLEGDAQMLGRSTDEP